MDDGRYVVRRDGSPAPGAGPGAPESGGAGGGEEASEVVVVTTIAAPLRTARRRRRSKRPRRIDAPDPPAELPATRVTVVRPSQLGEESEAERWLSELRREPDALAELVHVGVRVLNLLLHAHRAATMDPFVAEVTPEAAAAVRVGWGTGDQLAGGRWSAAISVPFEAGRGPGRADALRPQERLAAILAGREAIEPFETMILRARLDIDQDRVREAALELRSALQALLAQPPPSAGGATGGDAGDRDRLAGARSEVERIAGAAARDRLGPDDADLVAEALAVCERLLRRRAAYRS